MYVNSDMKTITLKANDQVGLYGHTQIHRKLNKHDIITTS